MITKEAIDKLIKEKTLIEVITSHGTKTRGVIVSYGRADLVSVHFTGVEVVGGTGEKIEYIASNTIRDIGLYEKVKSLKF